jgi:hypothetical protein
MKIAMWSGPRNLSTAMMYAFAARGDFAVVDEPFYAAYLAATGLDHPMREAVIASRSTDPVGVAADCIAAVPEGKTHYYQKHMTHHMIPRFDRGFMRQLTNVFLIRHPARVIASYAKKREALVLSDIGFVQQAELFDEVSDWLGQTPPVIDSADIRENPRQTLQSLCAALGLPFTEKMLHWPAGPKPCDGVWAPHWYNAVHQSTGFQSPESDPPDLPARYQNLVEKALPYYRKLLANKL